MCPDPPDEDTMNDPSPKPNVSSTVRPARSFVLRFISGKYQGGEFPIVPDKQIVVGRSSDLDMVLVEDMVSRKHARIHLQDSEIWIEDLGSTNGTFVNGEKIKRAKLKEGDRVLIGTSILKLIAADAGATGAPKVGDDAKKELESVAAQRRTSQAKTMSGSIEEVPLPDLLQLFGTSKKSGVLILKTDDDTGRIYMRKGIIYYAVVNENDDVPAMKSIFRMLTWTQGYFELDPPDEREFPGEINMGVQEILMEGLRQLDEFNEVRADLPDLHSRLVLTAPLVAPLRDLKPEELDVVQLVLNYGVIETVLNKSQATDLDTTRALARLIKASYLKPA